MVGIAGQAVAAILTRAPSAGGKSRLFTALGREADRALLSALLLDTFDAVAASGLPVVICFTPESARDELVALMPSAALFIPQRDGDLGERMRGTFDDVLRAGARGVVLVGSDLPLIDPTSIKEAADRVDRVPDSVVLGPTPDGGYYLIAATRTPTHLFENVRWGTPRVLDETRRLAQRHHVELAYVTEGSDIDTPEDLRALIHADSSRAPRTRQWVRTNC